MKEAADGKKHTYIAIDLKSFYASVECVERNLNPLTTNLVVADKSRTDKTICLAVSPSLKALGISGRPRLFQVVEQSKIQGFNYITAKPRMALYIDYSTRIYNIYLKYIDSQDIHVYSIDEVFMDVTSYLSVYKMTPGQLAETIIADVLKNTGITATAGIGENLYLAKVAMDIVAKHIPADKDGVRIAELDVMSYRKMLWNHKPVSDFWRVGKGYAKKLEEIGITTMGEVARCSLGKNNEYYNEHLLYKIFGVNAELLIDHAWGYEPCTIADIKAYKPQTKSLGAGQVLSRPYNYEETGTVIFEMADQLAMDLMDRGLVTSQLVLNIGYDTENLKKITGNQMAECKSGLKSDVYGRKVPKPAHGTINLKEATCLSSDICNGAMELFERITDKNLLVRRINITAGHVMAGNSENKEAEGRQLSIFDFMGSDGEKSLALDNKKEKERKVMEAVVAIKKKYGKNSVLRGTSFKQGATAKERNRQIGGHNA